MKKFFAVLFSTVIVLSFSAAVFAAGHGTTGSVKITKQLVLADDEPAPAPEPTPEPEPTPAPEPTPTPES